MAEHPTTPGIGGIVFGHKPYRTKPTLTKYIEFRLGQGAWTQLRNWLTRTWGAPSFSAFWRFWNPVYGYFLFYYCYRPLRRLIPRAPAVVITFLICGFVLHDVLGWVMGGKVHFPEMTLMFLLWGGGVVVSDALLMDLSGRPLLVRVGVNIAYIGAVPLLVARL